MAEQHRTDPRHAAKLIETSPAWLRVSLVRDEVRAPHTREVRTQCVPPKVNNGNTPTREQTSKQSYILTAATASPEWLLARDQYMGHLMACATCYAPTGRYCATGTDLRARYCRADWNAPS